LQGNKSHAALRRWEEGSIRQKGVSTMSTEDNKALIRRFYEEVFNERNLAAIDDFLPHDHIDHTLPPGLPVGPEGTKQAIAMTLSGFPDLRITIEDMIAHDISFWRGRLQIRRDAYYGRSGDDASYPIASEEVSMNTLVVFDSQYGNTECIAQAIAEALRTFGHAQAVRIDLVHPVLLQKVELLVLGSPTQGFRPTQAMQSWLGTVSSQQLRGLDSACFDTRFRGFLWKISAAPSLARQLHTLGVEPIVPPESFFVKAMEKEGPLLAGERERAVRWALGIHQAYEARTAHLAAH
jgi:flavodoxin